MVLPDSLVTLGADSFFGCTKMTSASLGPNLTTVGGYSFYGCTRLREVEFRDSDSGALAIGDCSFQGCSQLERVTFSRSLKSIGDNAFQSCTALKRVDFPDTLRTVGYGAFAFCTSLGEVVLGDGVTTLNSYNEYAYSDPTTAWYAFGGCTALTNIVFGSSLTAMYGSFCRCTALERVVLPDSLVTLGADSFFGCTRLGSVVLGRNVETIGGYAFGNCPCLRYLHFRSDPPATVGDNAFDSMKSAAVIFREDDNTEWPKTWRGYAVKPASEITADVDAPYDMVFHKFNDWPSSFFLTTDTNSLEATTRFLAGDPIYCAIAFRDAWGDIELLEDVTNILYVSGVAETGMIWIQKGWTAGKPGSGIFASRPLQNLAPGEYTATWVLNEPRSVRETNYANNTNSLTFTVVPSTAVTFISEGDVVATKNFEKGGTYGTLPAAPSRPYYDFTGWFTAANDGEIVTDSSKVPDDPISLYAHWQFHPTQINHVSGIISANKTWRIGDIYIVDDNLTIASGSTLVLEPGVIVKFAAGKSLTVNSGATLSAIGTRALPIVFTSIKDDANGGDTNGDGGATTAQPGDWARILVHGNATMDYCSLLYGSLGSGTDDILTVDGGSVRFSNGKMMNIGKYAVGLESGYFHMNNSVIAEAYCAFRHWPSDPIVNSVIYNCNRLSNNNGQKLYNCIIVGVNEAWDWSSGKGNTYRNCVFWNEAGFGLQKLPGSATSANGNIWANPLFIDPASGDFRIAANSPCIDAGDGTVAPELDYYGLARRDVAKVTDSGVPNAAGVCPDIGIHEVIWDGDKSPYDIAPTAVSVDKTAARVGDQITVSWTIRNLGTEDVVGGWHDAVSLISSSGQSVQLGEVVTTYPLKRGHVVNVKGTFTIPALPEGTWQARVNTNNRRSDMPEGRNTANNVLTAEQGIAISVDATPYAGGASGTLSAGSGTVVKFTFPAGTAGQIARVSVPAGLKISYGLGFMPQGAYASGTMTANENGEAMFHVPAGTTEVYLVMDDAQSDGQPYSVAFEEGELAILSVSPSTVPSSGSVSITIDGAGFSQNTTVSFVSDAYALDAQNVRCVSAEQLVVTFDGSEWDGGSMVSLRLDGGAAELANAFTVENTQGNADLVAKLILPDSIRERRIVTGWIEVENKGNVDAELPFYFISSTGGYEFNYAGFEVGWRDNLFIIAVDSNERVFVGAGEKYRIPFFVRAISQIVGDCLLSELDESKSLNMAAVCTQMNWDVSDNDLMANVTRLCGGTWFDFASNVRRYLHDHPIGAYYSGSVEKIVADYLIYNSAGVPIVGRLFDNNGSVIADCQDVMLCMESEDANPIIIAQTHTDANGFYYFPGLSNGVYSVEIPTYTLHENGLILSGKGMVHDVFANKGNTVEVRGSVSRSDLCDGANMVIYAINEHLGYYREIQVTNNEFSARFPALCNGEWRFGLSLNNSTMCEMSTNLFAQETIVSLPEVDFLTVRGRVLENGNVVNDYTVNSASMIGAPVVNADGSFSFVMLKQTNEVDETLFFYRDNSQYAQNKFAVNANESELDLGDLVLPTLVHVRGLVYEMDESPVCGELIMICDSNGVSRVVSLSETGAFDFFIREGLYAIVFTEEYESVGIQVSQGMDDVVVHKKPINMQALATAKAFNKEISLMSSGNDLSRASIAELKETEEYLFMLAWAFPAEPRDLLRFYLGDDGVEVRKIQKIYTNDHPWEFKPNSRLSQEAKSTDDPFFAKPYKDIKGSIYGYLQDHCSFDSCSLKKGEKPNLDSSFRLEFQPADGKVPKQDFLKAVRKPLFLSFGGMSYEQPGDIALKINDVTRTQDDSGETATYHFDVTYHGKDKYDFKGHTLPGPSVEGFVFINGEWIPILGTRTYRLGILEAANPQWAIPFWTELQIQDNFEVTITKEKPDPPKTPKDRRHPTVPQSCDPNEMVGPEGTGEARYVQPGEWMTYTIYFENKTNATAAAQEVYVSDALSDCLDWSTFEMGEIAFGNQIDLGLSGMRNGTSDATMEGTNFIVRTSLSLDETTGLATWYLRIVDPSDDSTWPADPYAGFLPPNNPETHCGEGHLTYRVKVREDADPGARIDAAATIVFDYNAPIITDPAWWNTVAAPARIAFSANGGTGSMDGVFADYEGRAALPANSFKRADYAFAGWATSPGGKAVYKDKWSGATGLAWGDTLTLYAVWTPTTYTVKFSANGGKGTMAAQKFSRGATSALRANAFARSGYTFIGWSKSASGAVAYANKAKVRNLAAAGKTVTLYAQWAKSKYTVKFNAYGGKLPKGRKMAAQTFKYGTAAKLTKNAFTRKGYVFAGWATSKANAKKGVIAYANAQSVKNLRVDGKAVTLYAVWAKPKYKVAFYANGGKGATVVQTLKYGKAAKLAKCKFKAPKGRKFAGWATSAANAKAGKVKYKNAQAVKNLIITGKTVKLYAVWKK